MDRPNMDSCYDFRVYADGDNRNPSYVKLHQDIEKYIIDIKEHDLNNDSDDDYSDDED